MSEQRPMSIFDTQQWTIDEGNKLYWNGKPIVTEDRIVFQKYVNWAIYLTAISTAAYSFVEVLKFCGYGG